MLGINLMFAGFALILNGISCIKPLNNKMVAIINGLVCLIIFLNSAIGVFNANGIVDYANAAGGFLFAINYLIIFAERMFNSDFIVFGWFEMYAFIMSFAFGVYALVGEFYFIAVLWFMWFVLWLVGFLATIAKWQFAQKISPLVLVLSGIISTGVPGLLILFQIF